MRPILRYWMFPAAMAALIYFLSSLNGNQLAAVVGPWGSIPHLDKLGHALIYAIFGWSLIRAFTLGPCWPLAWRVVATLAMVIGYGAADELHQSFVTGRTCDPNDWVADSVGCSLAVAVWSCFYLGESLLCGLMILRIRHLARRPRTNYPSITFWQRTRIQAYLLVQNLLIIEETIGDFFELRLRKTPSGHRLYRPAQAFSTRRQAFHP